MSKNRLYTNIMESYKFHYLRNFHHFRLMSKPGTILVLCCKVCTGQESSVILTSLTTKNVHVNYNVTVVNFLYKYCLVIYYIDWLQSAEPHVSLKFIYV